MTGKAITPERKRPPTEMALLDWGRTRAMLLRDGIAPVSPPHL
jgi:hypothetical protein